MGRLAPPLASPAPRPRLLGIPRFLGAGAILLLATTANGSATAHDYLMRQLWIWYRTPVSDDWQASGTGCVFGPNRVYTANHVVPPNYKDLGWAWVYRNELVGTLRVVKRYPERDLALLEVDQGPMPPLSYSGRTKPPAPGAEVCTLLWLPGHTIRRATSSCGPYYGEVDSEEHGNEYEYGALGGPGSSGSCLLDAEGRLIGIVLGRRTWGPTGAQVGVNIAVPLP